MLFQPFNKNAKLLAESFKRIVALKLIGTTVVGLYACYFYKENIPRAGPIRALILGWRTQAELESLREQDVEWIKNKISVSHPTGGKFYVVRGPRGIGKSVAVDWATNNMPGVIKIPPISPGKSKDEILDIVCSDITGLRGTCLEHRQSMKRIIFFFKLFNRRAPVVIIPAGQCERNKTPAELTNAARELVDTYGLIVLIDLSENAFPHVLSGREVFYDMEPMSDEMMRKLPGFEDTFESLKKQGNEEIVLRVCGGRPIILEELKDRLIECKSEAEKLKAVEDFVEARLDQARIDIENVQSHPNMAALLERFRKDSEVMYHKDKELPDLKDVFRIVRKTGPDNTATRNIATLVPATGAISIVLRYGQIKGKKIEFANIKAAVASWSNKND